MTPRELHLTPDAPWPGPAAYAERDAAFFFGRAAETAELHRLIHAEPVCVLHALSGLGKTSLLQAGVFPRLRADGWLPVRIRLDHRDLDDDGNAVPTLVAQVLAFIAQAAQSCGVSVPEWNAEKDTLAAAFHERGERFWGAREDEAVTPVLVFDQFEECWTQTRDKPEARARAEALLGQIAALLDWRGSADLAPAPMRVVFALREDQLAPLDALRPLFPGLRRARLRLLPFTAAQAMEVVTGKDGTDGSHESHLLDDGAAAAIVETFAARDAERPVADPALLSIFCWRLNEDRRERNADTISAARVVALRGEFVQQFYDAAFAQLPLDQAQAARRFIETDLIDAAGFRSSAGFEHAEKKYRVSPASLDRLVDARLLHPVDRSGGHRHVELVHDRIGDEAMRQRTAHEEAEAKARDAADKQKLQADLTKARRRAFVLGALTLVALFAMILAVVMWRQARRSQQDAETAKNDFKHQAEIALAASQRADLATQEARQSEAKARTAQAEAEIAAIKTNAALAAAETANKNLEAEKTRADQARDKAVTAKKSADDLISFMQYDLRDSLEKLGRLDMMKSMNDRIARYHEDHPPEKGDVSSERAQGVRLGQQGDILLAQGDLKAALVSYQKSLAIAERLAQQEPNDAFWQRGLSFSHNRIGDAQVAAGEGKAALESYQKGLAIIERVALQDPVDVQWQLDLSVSYIHIGDAQAVAGDGKAALVSYQKSLAIAERLARQDPGNADWQRELSVSYDRIGDAQAAAGEGKAALEWYQKSLVIHERLAQQDPSNAKWQRDLSVSYDRIADAHDAAGEGKAALVSYQKSLAIRERLAQQDPSNVNWQRDLSVSYERIADAHDAAGEGKAALVSYQKSLAIRERLAQQDPSNAEWQRDLSGSYEKIGKAQAAAGDRKAALETYQKSLAIRERLAQQDPGNAQWQRDLFVSYERIADAHDAAGEGKAALELYQKSLVIAERLAQQDPGNAQWQQNLSVSHYAISKALEKQGDLGGALERAEASLKIDEKLSALDPTNATWQGFVKESRALVKRLRAKAKK